MERIAIVAAATLKSPPLSLKTRMQCPQCKERFEADKGICYCEELHRRQAYDGERARRGLVPLYRPPSLR